MNWKLTWNELEANLKQILKRIRNKYKVNQKVSEFWSKFEMNSKPIRDYQNSKANLSLQRISVNLRNLKTTKSKIG